MVHLKLSTLGCRAQLKKLVDGDDTSTGWNDAKGVERVCPTLTEKDGRLPVKVYFGGGGWWCRGGGGGG